MKSLSDDHPSAENLVPSVRRSVEAARRFVAEKGIVTIPSGGPPPDRGDATVRPLGSFASMDTPGAYKTKATEAFYYVTPVEPDWDPAHREEHLRLYNPPAVGMINVHEAFPGHFLQFLYVQRFPTKIRKLLYCSTNVEGWAHYCEEMMVDQGFGGDDPRFRLTQLQAALLHSSLHRRHPVAHPGDERRGRSENLRAEGVSRSRPMPMRRPAAAPTTRRTCPTPSVSSRFRTYRSEYRARTGRSLRDFHDAFVAQGGLPFPLMHRILLHDVPRSAASWRPRGDPESRL